MYISDSEIEKMLHDTTTPQIDLVKIYSNSRFNLRQALDDVVRSNGYGDMSSINFLTLNGFNYYRHGQQLVSNNRDNMGYVFFTRPILNLTYDNLAFIRDMTSLRNAPRDSLGRYIRDTLDPWGQNPSLATASGYKNDKFKKSMEAQADHKDRMGGQMCNPHNPFIPLLSNTLLNLSGWKDISLNDYTSPAGIYNEQWMGIDGYYYKTEVFEMNASFRNIDGDPVSKLFHIWEQYIVACRTELMHPYPVFVSDREYDYNTKIYRFIMDRTKKYIQKWAATIAAPISLNYSSQYNYSKDKNFQEANDEINVSFKCVGSDYNDPIVLWEFNKLVSIYTPGLTIDWTKYNFATDSLVVKDPNNWVKLKDHEKLLGTYLAIPLINTFTRELEWWINMEDYNTYIRGTQSRGVDTSNLGISSLYQDTPISDHTDHL